MMELDLTRTLPSCVRELPGGNRAVALVVTSKLLHRSVCKVQSIQPTFTRPFYSTHTHTLKFQPLRVLYNSSDLSRVVKHPH